MRSSQLRGRDRERERGNERQGERKRGREREGVLFRVKRQKGGKKDQRLFGFGKPSVDSKESGLAAFQSVAEKERAPQHAPVPAR